MGQMTYLDVSQFRVLDSLATLNWEVMQRDFHVREPSED
jgi:hypothetical protein